MSDVLRGRQEIPDKFTPSFIQERLDEDDDEYEAKKAEMWEVITLLLDALNQSFCQLFMLDDGCGCMLIKDRTCNLTCLQCNQKGGRNPV